MEDIFSRNKLFWGDDFQKLLSTKNIFVFGLGGVGGFALESLARCGFENFTIIDFVSDLRAPTPSAAAELLTCIKNDRKNQILQKFSKIQKITHEILADKLDMYYGFREIFEKRVKEILREKEYEFALTQQILEKHNPAELLNKGYAFVEKGGKAVEFGNIQENDDIDIIVKGGKIGAVVKSKIQK